MWKTPCPVDRHPYSLPDVILEKKVFLGSGGCPAGDAESMNAKLLQLLKAPYPISWRFAVVVVVSVCNSTRFNLAQLEKASVSSFSRDFGNEIAVNELQLEKASSSIIRNDVGKTTTGPSEKIVMLTHPRNASVPILTIDDGNEITFNDVHPTKVRLPISRRDDDDDDDDEDEFDPAAEDDDEEEK